MSGATSSPSKFYVQRGTVQRKEDPGLGLQSQVIGGGGGGEVWDGTGGGDQIHQHGAGAPNVPPRSPSRALRGDAYF